MLNGWYKYILTMVENATGFSISGGTSSKTLTMDQDITVSRLVLVDNLKPVINAAANKLDIFTQSGGAAPDASHIIAVAIPDGNGHTFRSRAATYLAGTSQIIMADAANYWSKGSLDAEIKTAWLYAIWDGTGIVWALAGYSGFTMVPTTTTATDDDYFLLEDSSTYTRSNSHYCVAVAKIRYQYDTADTPDHTIQATVENAPQVIWNPKSDYGFTAALATSNTSADDIAAYSAVSKIVRQSGLYLVSGSVLYICVGGTATGFGYIKTGSTFGDAVEKSASGHAEATANSNFAVSVPSRIIYLHIGDTVHLGAELSGGSGNRIVRANDYISNCTSLSAWRID